MTGGIAFLLRGSPVDLSATFHAVELAKRTTGVVHAVVVEQERANTGNDSVKEEIESRILSEQIVALAGWLGDVEGVAIHTHKLDSPTDEVLIQFLCNYQIFCLIFGVESQRLRRRKTVWVAHLQRLLAQKCDYFYPRLWSAIIPPGDDLEYTALLDRCDQTAGSGSTVGLLIDNLRSGLKRLNNK